MGKKKKKEKKRPEKDEVIYIDLNEEDNSDKNSTEHEHIGTSFPERPKRKKKRAAAVATNTEQITTSDNDDCIDLTEQNEEPENSDHNSEEVLLIEDESESEAGRRMPLTTNELMRKCNDKSAENVKKQSRKDKNKEKTSKKKEKMKSATESWRKDSTEDKKEKKGGRTQPQKGKKKPKVRQEQNIKLPGGDNADERNQRSNKPVQSPRMQGRDRGSDKEETVGNSSEREDDCRSRQSPRKRKSSLNDGQDHRSRSGDRDDDSTQLRQSPRKRRKSGSGDRQDSGSGDRQDARRRSLSSAKRRNGVIGESGETEFVTSNDRRPKTSSTAVDAIDLEAVDGAVTTLRNQPVAFPIKTGAVIILSHPSQFILKGKATVQPLAGSVTIMGHLLKDSRKTYNIYSPECSSLLTLETVAGESNKDCIMKSVSSHISRNEDIEILRDKLEDFKSAVIFKVTSLFPSLGDIVRTLPPCQYLFSMGGDWDHTMNNVLSPLGFELFQSPNAPHLEVTNELREAIDDWTESLSQRNKVPLCMMVVGGKDSGKSTTNRLLINASLNRIKSIYFLECDVGQTEFTPSGCVSLHCVTEPVIGPPFCHQRKPLCSYFFGGLSPEDDPSVYLQCVKRCVQHYQQLGELGPLIVNTMGWVKGLGLQLLVDTLRLVCPSHIIQLWCQQKYQNCEPINENFYLQPSWEDMTKGKCSWEEMDERTNQVQTTRRQHKLLIVNSVAKSVDLTGMLVRLKPVDFRNLSLLTHLYSNIDPHMTLTSQTPYVLQWKSIAIHVCYMSVPWEQIMYAINASVVALCHADLEQTERLREDSPMFFRSMPICKWIGYGLVRGVDPVKKELYIVTSVDVPSLKHVNTLIKGSVTLPDQVFIKQHCHGNRLYVDDSVQSLGLAIVKPRRYMPRTHLQNSAAAE